MSKRVLQTIPEFCKENKKGEKYDTPIAEKRDKLNYNLPKNSNIINLYKINQTKQEENGYRIAAII